MIRFATYKYTGENGSKGYYTGRRYNLAIKKLSLLERLVSNYPASWKIIAFRPFEHGTCILAYTSVQEFEADWTKVAKTQSVTEKMPAKPLITA